MIIYRTGAPNPLTNQKTNDKTNLPSPHAVAPGQQSAKRRPLLRVIDSADALNAESTATPESIDYYFGQVSALYRQAV